MNPESLLFAVTRQPRDDYYDEFLDWVGARADLGCVVVRPDLGMESAGKEFFRELSPFIQSEIETSEWPGTRLLAGETASVITFRLTAESIALLKRTARGLYDWTQPDLPEDLGFLAGNKPIVSTIAHESECYLSLTSGELDELSCRFPRLAAIIEPI